MKVGERVLTESLHVLRDPRVEESAKKRFDELQAQWEELQREMTALLEQDLARFNALFEEHGIPAVVVSGTP